MTAAAPLFTPSGQTVEIIAGTTSSSATLGLGNSLLRVVNAGTNLAFIRIGTGPVVATTSDYPLVENLPEIIAKDPNANVVAVITTQANNPVYITPGD